MEEMIYVLGGFAMHKREQPTSGHYTSFGKAVGSFALIDDKQAHVDSLNKDGYFLTY